MITNYSMAASRSLSSASRISAGLVSAIAAVMLLAMPTIAAAQSADHAPAGWKLVWSDEFEGDAIDRANGTAKVTGGAAFGLYLATIAGVVMTYGAVRNLMTARATHAAG